MANRNALRLAASLVLIGDLVFIILVQYVHPGGGNTEAATFAINAASANWTAIHLSEFVAMAVLLAGLLVLFVALNVAEGTPRWLGFFGAMAAGVALVLTAVLSALDGVANKQAEAAWVSAPSGDKAARFASAEALRWLEWGLSSYHSFLLGFALVLFALVIVWTARVPRPIGCLMGVSGLALLVVGWLIGTRGFTSANTLPSAVGYLGLFAAMIWLLVAAWRMKQEPEPVPGAPAQAIPQQVG